MNMEISSFSEKKIIHQKVPDLFYTWILALYLVLSVVNWLPLLDSGILRWLKYFLYGSIFLYELVNYKIRFISNYLSALGLFIIILTMVPGLVLSMDISAIIDIFIPFTVIWILNYKRDYYYNVLKKASMIVALICSFSVISYLTGFFNFEANGPFFASFAEAGFGGYPTGYSNSLFLFIPFLVYYNRVSKNSIFSWETLTIGVIIIAQYICGGRAGLLASLFVIFFGFRTSIYYKIALVALMVVFFQSPSVQRHFRLTNASQSRYERNLDDISSGRVYLTNYYYQKFKERPIFGYGFGDKPEMQTSLEAHIVWLRNLIDGGIIYVIFLIYFFIEIFRRIRRNLTLSKEEHRFFLILFVSTLIITFLEPNYLIGSVQGEIVYWFIISLLLKRKGDENEVRD